MSVTWEQQARLAAEAFGINILVGVRGHNGTWFAHADGLKCDGSDAEDAVKAVIEGLVKRAQHEARVSHEAARRYEAQLTAMGRT